MSEPEKGKKDRSQEDKDFVKFYRQFIQRLGDLSIDNPTALKVLLFLIRNMDGYNALGVSSKVISSMVGTSRQTVSKSLKYLKENGWIEIFKQGTSNVYVINPDIAWTSYADQKQYCKFTGTIILSAEENWEILRNPKSKNHYKFIDSAFVARYENELTNKLDSNNNANEDELTGQTQLFDFMKTNNK